MSRSALRHTVRAIPWHAPAIAAGIAALFTLLGPGQSPVLALQVSAILLAASAAFAIDDPAFEVLAASPSPLITRRLARLLVVIPAVSVVWGILLVAQRPSTQQEVWTLVALYCGLLGLSIGFSGLVGRRTSGRGGTVAAPLLLVALVLSSIITPRWRPLPLGDIPGGWTALEIRWSLAALAGFLLFTISSRDAQTGRESKR